MQRLWIWWWKQRAGDSSESILFKPRFDEALKALRLLLLKTFRLIEPRFVLFVSLAAFIAAMIVAWNIPVFHRIWADEFWDAKNGQGVRDLVLAATTLVGALIGLAGYLLLAVRTNAIQRQTDLQHEAQITDRFTKAIEQLGHDKIAVRLGAIYALERVAKDSERDFATIIETLAAYVRERVPRQKPNAFDEPDVCSADVLDAELDERKGVRVSIDVAATISVLARSIPNTSILRTGEQIRRVDLRNVSLVGLDLPGANLSGFRFDNSDLSYANLSEANLTSSSFRGIEFRGGNLERSTLNSANFSRSDLREANFSSIQCEGANFRYSQFSETEFEGSQIKNSDFHTAKIMACGFVLMEFVDCDFDDTSFSDAYLSGTTFVDCSLIEGDFEGATLSRVVFIGCNLSKTRFESAVFEDWADIESDEVWPCEFEGSDLSAADFSNSDGLKESYLSGAFYMSSRGAPIFPTGISAESLEAIDDSGE